MAQIEYTKKLEKVIALHWRGFDLDNVRFKKPTTNRQVSSLLAPDQQDSCHEVTFSLARHWTNRELDYITSGKKPRNVDDLYSSGMESISDI